jgi:murein tripeptide amidase MpaA
VLKRQDRASQIIEIRQQPFLKTQEKSQRISGENWAALTDLVMIRPNTGIERTYKVRL